MKKANRLKIALLVLVMFSGIMIDAPQVSAESLIPKTIAFSSSDEREIFNLVNKQRRKSNLNELQWDSDLEKLARNYSRKMASGNFFSHYDRNGDSIVQRAKALKISGWRKLGENLFKSDAFRELNKFAVEKWMQSPGHRVNILDRSYNSTAIGIAQAKDGTVYITQIFAQK